MFDVSLRHANHTRHYSVLPLERAGWEVRLEEDRELTRHARYDDWHRVERALATFQLEVSRLRASGWQQDN
jgi:hypothetical protein